MLSMWPVREENGDQAGMYRGARSHKVCVNYWCNPLCCCLSCDYRVVYEKCKEGKSDSILSALSLDTSWDLITSLRIDSEGNKQNNKLCLKCCIILKVGSCFSIKCNRKWWCLGCRTLFAYIPFLARHTVSWCHGSWGNGVQQGTRVTSTGEMQHKRDITWNSTCMQRERGATE